MDVVKRGSFMDLKPLTLEDMPVFQKFYEISGYEGYNSNFVTMFMWNHEYNVHYYASDHYLIALCHYEHLMFWNMPLTTKEYFKEAIDAMRSYSKEHELPFYIDGVLNEPVQWLEELYPGEFKIIKERGEFDYIYERSMHETLAGKKMQKRRNHYNTFIKLYGDRYHYRALKADDVAQVSELLDLWSESKKDDPNIQIEKKGIISLFDVMDQLPYRAGCIEIDGHIEAFIIGSMLNHETLQIHVEKANTEYRGLYVAILKCFLEHEFKEAKFLNREDDMNIESMRQAKLNLHPVKLLEKSFVYPNQITYRPSKEDDYAQLMSAWKANFSEDSDAYIRDYFKTYYQPENTWVAVNERMIIGVVHLRPVQIVNHGEIQTARYIEGVSTHFMFRHQGYMRTLLTKAMAALPCDYYLLQAYQWEIYDFLEFSDYTYKVKAVLHELLETDRIQVKEDMDEIHCLTLYNTFTKEKNGFPLRNEDYYKHLHQTLSLSNQHCIESEDGYLIYEMMEDKCVVLEAITCSRKVLKAMLNVLIEKYGSIIVLLEQEYEDMFENEKILFLKIKSCKSAIPQGNIYFNEYI